MQSYCRLVLTSASSLGRSHACTTKFCTDYLPKRFIINATIAKQSIFIYADDNDVGTKAELTAAKYIRTLLIGTPHRISGS